MGKRARARAAGADGSAELDAAPARPRGRFGRPKRTPWSERERLGHEAPGTVLRGPPIAVTCECGEKRDLKYGDRWTCETCGRIWDTEQIPKADYEHIRKTQFKFRLLPIGLGLLTLSMAIFFTLTGNLFSMFLLLPVALMAWFMIVRPLHRKAYRKAIADLPRWELRPQGP